MMRLANGIVLDKDTTFGELKFSALRREVRIQNEDGTVSEEIKERTYDLKSKGQGRMIQVSIPASVPLKEFEYNARVELINPIADTVATATFQGADVDWYIKADDIVLTKDSNSFRNQQPPKKEAIMDEALKFEGWKYVYGGASPTTSFDCSGLTQWTYGKAGINLPRTAQQQYDVTRHIPLLEAKAGDLVFFHSTYNAGSYITHIGIYLGDNRMFHAGDPIGYADLTSSYWQQHLVGAGRIKQ